MYFYLFDSFLNHKKYKKEVIEIENKIPELGIEGKNVHLTVLKNFTDSLKGGLKMKFETIVVVGNDETVFKAINVLADIPVVLGIIPLGEPCQMAKLLGIPKGHPAVDVLANRLIEKLDLGKINKKYFLTSVLSEKGRLFLECDKKYQIFLSSEKSLSINNLARFSSHICNPRDGLLETMVFSGSKKLLSKKSEEVDSLFFHKKIIVKSVDKTLSLLLDGVRILKTPAEIEIAPKKLKMIVGRERVF